MTRTGAESHPKCRQACLSEGRFNPPVRLSLIHIYFPDADLWEPDDGRLSRPVLREPGGEIPPGYSTRLHNDARGSLYGTSAPYRPMTDASEKYSAAAGGRMDPFAQAHLSELLSAARLGPLVHTVDPVEHKARTLMTFNAALAALKGVGAISDEDMACLLYTSRCV